MAGKNKKLYRSATNSKVAGVCGGLGDYFSVDPLIFRLIFLVLLLPGGAPGVIPYLILWVLVPREPFANTPSYQSPVKDSQYKNTYDV